MTQSNFKLKATLCNFFTLMNQFQSHVDGTDCLSHLFVHCHFSERVDVYFNIQDFMMLV